MHSASIRDVARDAVATARPDTNARTLAERMRDEDVGSVVVTDDGHPLGIVTDRDLTVRVLARGRDGTDVYAREVMTGHPTTISEDASLFEVAQRMHEEEVRRLPVVDGGDTLTGIIALDDVHQRLVDEQEHLTGVVEAESPDRIR